MVEDDVKITPAQFLTEYRRICRVLRAAGKTNVTIHDILPDDEKKVYNVFYVKKRENADSVEIPYPPINEKALVDGDNVEPAKESLILGMIDHVDDALDDATDGTPLFIAETVDILEILHPRFLYMTIDDGTDLTIDLQEQALNSATKDQCYVLLSSISPDRVHVQIEGAIDKITGT